jgi:hypothetical protein
MQDLNTQDKLEQAIDATSLSTVLNALVTVCDLKARHIEENWQDGYLSSKWEEISNHLDRVAALAKNFRI